MVEGEALLQRMLVTWSLWKESETHLGGACGAFLGGSSQKTPPPAAACPPGIPAPCHNHCLPPRCPHGHCPLGWTCPCLAMHTWVVEVTVKFNQQEHRRTVRCQRDLLFGRKKSMLFLKLETASGIFQIKKKGFYHKSSMQVDHFNKSITTATRGINKSSTWIIKGHYEGGNDGCALHKLSPPLFKKNRQVRNLRHSDKWVAYFWNWMASKW